ncbi:MAG: hypothetical protein IKT40_12465 [Bacilli bacterium]|nr:hypothetical protein [Bacilli bacterium]
MRVKTIDELELTNDIKDKFSICSDSEGNTEKFALGNIINPIYRVIDNKLNASYDGGVTFEPASDYIASYFRWSNNNTIQISNDNVTWTNLSEPMSNNLFIKGYVDSFDQLPTNEELGAIYMVGTEAPFHMHILTSEGWEDNGAFTSITAGVAQEMGDSETLVMSQKAVTDNFISNDKIMQTTGDSESAVMSQKVVSEEIANIGYFTQPLSAVKEIYFTKDLSQYSPRIVRLDRGFSINGVPTWQIVLNYTSSKGANTVKFHQFTSEEQFIDIDYDVFLCTGYFIIDWEKLEYGKQHSYNAYFTNKCYDINYSPSIENKVYDSCCILANGEKLLSPENVNYSYDSKIIKYDGRLEDADSTFKVFEIENTDKTRPIYLDVATNSSTIYPYINVAFYKAGLFIKGLNIGTRNILQLPCGCSVKISGTEKSAVLKSYNVVKKQTSQLSEFLVDSYQGLDDATKLAAQDNPFLIDLNGDLTYGIQSTYKSYEIKNFETSELYVGIDFGKTVPTQNVWLSVGIYDADNAFVAGGVLAGYRILRIPKNYTIYAVTNESDVVYSRQLETKEVKDEKCRSSIKGISKRLSKVECASLNVIQNKLNSTSEKTNYYVHINGTLNANDSFSVKEFNVEDCDKISVNCTIRGGLVVSVISSFDKNGKFINSYIKGTTDSTLYISEIIDIASDISKISVCTNNDNIDTIEVFSIKTHPKLTKIQTWGDSITEAGKYQLGIANKLGLTNTDVKNAGIASDFSMHVRNRFVSYFTEEIPYVGTGVYNVPTMEERNIELQESFFVFWIGTNNLLNPNRTAGTFTTSNESYNKLQPNPDFRYDRLYSRSYKDMMLNDIRQMVNMLPHNNFAIIGGHGGFSSDTDMRQKMLEVDAILARMYPRNYIDIRELVVMDYDYQDTYVVNDFVKPSLNSSVTIKLSKTDWIGSDKNTSRMICIGTKSIYDKYNVSQINSDGSVSATLVESNTEFNEGDTIRSQYLLVSDLGRDSVNMRTAVFSYEDCVSFGLMSFPRSSSDPIHFTNEQYYIIGQLIGREIQKIIN